MAKLFIVATPIGNLEDITMRALHTLSEVDYILCEDTRVTKKLLFHYEIDKPLLSYHQHSSDRKTEEIVQLLKKGNDIALVCDAGTPNISDPGSNLINAVYSNEEIADKTDVIPIPGPSAVAAIASVAGFGMSRFCFHGFVPQKKGKNKFLNNVLESDYPVIFFESTHRILKTLNLLQKFIQERGENYSIVLGRELTKKFEDVYRGDIDKVIDYVSNDKKQKGEFVIIVSKAKNNEK